MDVSYRIATLDDIEKMSRQLTNSYVTAYKNLMSEEYLSSLPANHWMPILEESIQRGDICLIAEQHGKIVGSSVFGVANKDDELNAEWHAFYLLPQYIGQGIGHSFYERIEKEMQKMGCRVCILEVLSTNERAIRFYLSHGFVKSITFMVEENGMVLSCDKIKNFFNRPVVCNSMLRQTK